MQQVLHCCSSGCRFSICFADAEELNSSLPGSREGSTGWDLHCSIPAVSSSLRQPVCATWGHMARWICFPKSPLELSLRKEGWGFGGCWWYFPKVLWLEMSCVGSADLREPQPGCLEGLCASSSSGWNWRIKGFCFVFLCDEKSKDENLMNLDKNYLRGVDTTISTLSWLAEQLHQVLMSAFHFCLLLFNRHSDFAVIYSNVRKALSGFVLLKLNGETKQLWVIRHISCICVRILKQQKLSIFALEPRIWWHSLNLIIGYRNLQKSLNVYVEFTIFPRSTLMDFTINLQIHLIGI